jgi:hypothetical protein
MPVFTPHVHFLYLFCVPYTFILAFQCLSFFLYSFFFFFHITIFFCTPFSYSPNNTSQISLPQMKYFQIYTPVSCSGNFKSFVTYGSSRYKRCFFTESFCLVVMWKYLYILYCKCILTNYTFMYINLLFKTSNKWKS